MTGLFRTIFVHFVVLMPLAGVAAQERAMLNAGDGSTVNGINVRSSMAVVKGDKIRTGKGTAQITATGLYVDVDSDSAVLFGDALQLGCGAVSVNGMSAVRGNNFTISPVSTAKYRVANRGGNLLVSVQSGSIRVSGGETILLSAGQSATLPGTAACAADPINAQIPAKGNRKLFGAVAGLAGAGVITGVVATRPEASLERR